MYFGYKSGYKGVRLLKYYLRFHQLLAMTEVQIPQYLQYMWPLQSTRLRISTCQMLQVVAAQEKKRHQYKISLVHQIEDPGTEVQNLCVLSWNLV